MRGGEGMGEPGNGLYREGQKRRYKWGEGEKG